MTDDIERRPGGSTDDRRESEQESSPPLAVDLGRVGDAASQGGPCRDLSETMPQAAPPDNSADMREAVRFLQMLLPDGPWVLWAKTPDGSVECSPAFRPSQEYQVRAWVETRAATRNLYYHVNPYPEVRRKGGRLVKAEKGDITEVRYLHVDVDRHP